MYCLFTNQTQSNTPHISVPFPCVIPLQAMENDTETRHPVDDVGGGSQQFEGISTTGADRKPSAASTTSSAAEIESSLAQSNFEKRDDTLETLKYSGVSAGHAFGVQDPVNGTTGVISGYNQPGYPLCACDSTSPVQGSYGISRHMHDHSSSNDVYEGTTESGFSGNRGLDLFSSQRAVNDLIYGPRVPVSSLSLGVDARWAVALNTQLVSPVNSVPGIHRYYQDTTNLGDYNFWPHHLETTSDSFFSSPTNNRTDEFLTGPASENTPQHTYTPLADAYADEFEELAMRFRNIRAFPD